MQSVLVSGFRVDHCVLPTELSDVHNVVLVLQDSSLVVVHIEVVWCTEDGHDTRETRRPGLPVHSVPGILGFVRTDDRQKVILFEEGTGSGV